MSFSAEMGEPSDLTIRTRARLAGALAAVVEADPRVRRWRRLDFADDGGAVLAIELRGGPDATARQVIARELEFLAAVAVPRLAWVRIQVD
jgi:hypothetical protein